MLPEHAIQLEQRKKGFEDFFNELMPALVDFIEKIGINPAHQVLNQAEKYVPFVEASLRDIVVADKGDRVWLLTRVGYFIGEYFSQKYGGCWYVNDICDSRYFARYVVGKFSKTNNMATMIDPFEIAQVYVDTPVPREMTVVLAEVDAQIGK